MSDRTPPGIKPGSDGRGWRIFVYVVIGIIFAPLAVVLGFLLIGLLS